MLVRPDLSILAAQRHQERQHADEGHTGTSPTEQQTVPRLVPGQNRDRPGDRAGVAPVDASGQDDGHDHVVGRGDRDEPGHRQLELRRPQSPEPAQCFLADEDVAQHRSSRSDSAADYRRARFHTWLTTRHVLPAEPVSVVARSIAATATARPSSAAIRSPRPVAAARASAPWATTRRSANASDVSDRCGQRVGRHPVLLGDPGPERLISDKRAHHLRSAGGERGAGGAGPAVMDHGGHPREQAPIIHVVEHAQIDADPPGCRFSGFRVEPAPARGQNQSHLGDRRGVDHRGRGLHRIQARHGPEPREHRGWAVGQELLDVDGSAELSSRNQ